MSIQLKSIDSTDVDLVGWLPSHPEEVYFPVFLTIGRADKEGGDLFQVLVVTPEGLRKHGHGDVLSDRATLVLADYSPALLRQALERIVCECKAESWQESFLRLQRYFAWEYEDFR